MNTNYNAIREKGFNALVRELGTVDTVAFLRNFENGSGSYTEERESLHSGVTIDDIVSRIKIKQNAEQ